MSDLTAHATFEEAARAAGCVTLAIPRRFGNRVEWVEALARMGDFAITPADPGHMVRKYPARKWVITHVHTGLKLPGKPVTARVAMGALEALAHVPAVTQVELEASADTIRSVCIRHLRHVPVNITPMPDVSAHFVEAP